MLQRAFVAWREESDNARFHASTPRGITLGLAASSKKRMVARSDKERSGVCTIPCHPSSSGSPEGREADDEIRPEARRIRQGSRKQAWSRALCQEPGGRH